MTEIIFQNYIFKSESIPHYLYLRGYRFIITTENELNISDGGSVEFSGYYNLFFPYYLKKYVNSGKIFIKIIGKGSCQFSLVSNDYFRNLPNISEKLDWNTDSYETKYLEIINLSELQYIERYFYPKIDDVGTSGFQLKTMELVLIENQNHTNPVHLGICVCTFKKEDYLYKNLEKIQSYSKYLIDYTIFISDNAGSLNIENDKNVNVYRNPNYGGSGGFSFTLMKALENPEVTHILFMDDDVDLEPEIIFRLKILYEFIGQSKICLSGGMIDILNPKYLFESGAYYNHKKMKYNPVNSYKNIIDPDLQMKINLKAEKMEYGGFWFFSLPRKSAEEAGLILPFFIRADDLEYNYRLRKFNNKIEYYPGLSVLHEPFYFKDPIWIHYYYFRNNLIFNSLRFKSAFWANWYALFKYFFYNAIQFKYDMIEALVKGVNDYYKGPEFIKFINPELFQKELLELIKNDPDKTVGEYRFPKMTDNKISLFLILKIVISVNGNIFRIKPIHKKEVIFFKTKNIHHLLSNCGGTERITFVNDANKTSISYNLNPSRFRKILFSFFHLFIKSIPKYWWIRREWQKSEKELISKEFWNHYLDKAR
ncbi:MAG: glycosyltransferase [Leptospiraceae bacterium]|nr:glycosyltransferase [Leptospiraceae bacterium]